LFDLIDVDVLAWKMAIYGVDRKTVMWIRSYLTGRLQLVENGGQKSEMRPVTNGSPQCLILSPLVFLILTSDMPEALTEGTIVTLADDTTVYVMHRARFD
jgi:hypothetical protein